MQEVTEARRYLPEMALGVMKQFYALLQGGSASPLKGELGCNALIITLREE